MQVHRLERGWSGHQFAQLGEGFIVHVRNVPLVAGLVIFTAAIGCRSEAEDGFAATFKGKQAQMGGLDDSYRGTKRHFRGFKTALKDNVATVTFDETLVNQANHMSIYKTTSTSVRWRVRYQRQEAGWVFLDLQREMTSPAGVVWADGKYDKDLVQLFKGGE